ncbi:MAG TPA: glycosyltransferase family 39 protein, partial [Anaerolineae bacterium]|nr:glycosyltransferase family 39 protein [Anaerolineae bacterium]
PYQSNALAWHLARLLSVAMGAVTVWATWQLARILLHDEWLALGAAALVAFLPEFLFISSVLNNDNLVVMFTALAILQTIRVLDKEPALRDYLLLGALLGLAALSKLSGFTVWLFTFLILAWKLWSAKSKRAVVANGALAFAVAVLVFAPYALYNLVNRGDPLAWSLLLQVTPIRQAPPTLGDWWFDLRGLYSSFWGRYGGALHLELPNWLYLGFSILALIALGGWSLYARAAWLRQLDRRIVRVFIFFALFWTFLLLAHVRWVLTVLGADQARQLFPGLPLLSIFLTVSFARVFLPRLRAAIYVWSACFLAASLFLVFILWSTYQTPTYTSAAALPSLGASAPADFGKTIRLLDYRVEPTQARPGDMVTFTAYWQSLKPTDENNWLLLQLFSENEAIVNKDGVPSAGRLTTDLWQPNSIYVSHHTFQIPPDAESGKYKLTLGLHPFGTYDWLKVKGGDIFPLGTIEVTH